MENNRKEKLYILRVYQKTYNTFELNILILIYF